MSTMQLDLASDMKNGMRRLAAGVSILSAQDTQGERYAMTVSSVTSVSDNPPSLLVCVNHISRICPVLSMGSAFAINILSSAQADVSIACASGEQNEKRFLVGQWRSGAGHTPELDGALAVFHCVVDAVQVYGTHNVLIGKITAVKVGKEEVDPLVYLNGAYRAIEKTIP